MFMFSCTAAAGPAFRDTCSWQDTGHTSAGHTPAPRHLWSCVSAPWAVSPCTALLSGSFSHTFPGVFFCLCKLFAPTASQGSELSCLTPDCVKWLTSSQSADCSSPVTSFTYFMQQSKSFFTSPPDFKRSQSFPLTSRTHLSSPVLHLEKQEAYPATPGFFCINAYSACRLHSSAPKLDSKDVQAEISPALDQGNL